MLEFLKTWVLNIVTLAFFIILVEILVPTGKMKKAVNLVTGLILVIALINPVLGLIGRGVTLNEFRITASNYIDTKEVMVNSSVLKEKQIAQITNVYRKKVIAQLEDISKEIKGVSGAKADIIINEDYNSANFGEVKRVYLTLSMEEEEKAKPVIKVERIKVGNGTNKEVKEPLAEREVDGKIRREIEEKVERMFGTKRENIVISLSSE